MATSLQLRTLTPLGRASCWKLAHHPLAPFRTPSRPRRAKHTAGMHDLGTLRPFAAQVRLCGSPVGTIAAVQNTAHPVLRQEAAGRNELGPQREGAGSLDLAEEGPLAGPDKPFEQPLFRGAHDLDLKVPAARSASAMIRSTARGCRAGVAQGVDRQLTPGPGAWKQLPGDCSPLYDNPEPVAAELARFGGIRWLRRESPCIAVGQAAGSAFGAWSKMATGDLNHRLRVKVPAVPAEVVQESQALGMTQQPGRLMIRRSGAVVQRGHAKGYPERIAVPTHARTGRYPCCDLPPGRHEFKIGGSRGVAWRRSAMYLCELVHKRFRAEPGAGPLQHPCLGRAGGT